MSLKDPLIQTENSKSEYEQLTYEEKPGTVLDYLIIVGLMTSTYVLIVSVLYGLIEWNTDSKNTLDNNNKYYRENNIFNLVIFCVYIVVFGTIWFFSIGKREIYRKRLRDEKLALQENLK